MVHALEIVHSLLEEGGLLIDIHPNGEAPPIEVVHGGQQRLAGYLQESDDFVEYAQASAALDKSVAMGLFDLERQGLFEFVTQADSLAELLEYLRTAWSDAIVAAKTQQRAAELLAGAGSRQGSPAARLVMTERVRIVRLRAKSL
ncbi:MAG: hypothetical protein JXA78_08040 [Anaerolineales bacterium]|nr:hypothetical protein [Anaerolineales bacterium]